MIRTGRADVVVAGGTEAAIHPLPIAAFANMMAMSKNNEDPQGASRPYDKARDGFVLGEGAGIVVLESAEHAAARGARVYCEASARASPPTPTTSRSPSPPAAASPRRCATCWSTTDLKPAEVVHVNAHATSTPQGDVGGDQGAAQGARRPTWTTSRSPRPSR